MAIARHESGYEKLVANDGNRRQSHGPAGEAHGEAGAQKKSRNEGRTHDVIDNKGPLLGTHDVDENK
jgi:hypothetical protein